MRGIKTLRDGNVATINAARAESLGSPRSGLFSSVADIAESLSRSARTARSGIWPIGTDQPPSVRRMTGRWVSGSWAAGPGNAQEDSHNVDLQGCGACALHDRGRETLFSSIEPPTAVRSGPVHSPRYPHSVNWTGAADYYGVR
jgi:hypothetical protein